MQSQQWIRRGLVLAMLSLGCGGSVNSSAGGPVSGTVTINGEPLAYGTAEFQSFDSKNVAKRAVITAGKFTFEGANGLPPGDYYVRLTPYEPEVEELGQIPEETRRKINAARNLIPAKYQQRNALEVKVANDALKFDLRSE